MKRINNKSVYFDIDILAILEKKEYEITILFENYEIRKIDYNKYINDNFANHKELLEPKIFNNLKIKDCTLYFPNYLKGFYVAPDNLYLNSKPVSFKPQYLSIIRKLKGISQKELAKQLNIQIKELAEIEKGNKNNLRIIAKALNFLI